MGRQRFKFIGCSDKRQAGNGGHILGNHLVPARRGVQPGAHSCAALGQLVDIA